MKKVLKSRIFIFISTAILFTGIGVYGATLKYNASEILYNSSDGTSTDVNEALNELYSAKTECESNQYTSVTIAIAGEAGGNVSKYTSHTINIGATGTWTTSGGTEGHGATLWVYSWNK